MFISFDSKAFFKILKLSELDDSDGCDKDGAVSNESMTMQRKSSRRVSMLGKDIDDVYDADD